MLFFIGVPGIRVEKPVRDVHSGCVLVNGGLGDPLDGQLALFALDEIYRLLKMFFVPYGAIRWRRIRWIAQF